MELKKQGLYISKFQTLFNKVKDQPYSTIFQQKKKTFQNILSMNYIESVDLLKTVKRMFLKYYTSSESDQLRDFQRSPYWGIGEYKLFGWSLIFLCLTNNISHSEISEIEISIMIDLFKHKTPAFIKFQIKKIKDFDLNKSRVWAQKQANILVSLLSQKNLPKSDRRLDSIAWRQISFKLFLNSDEEYARTSSQCHRVWSGYLCPQVRRCSWTLQEDNTVLELIFKNDFKWSLVSRLMQNSRSPHQVKDRFQHYRRKWKMLKIFNAKMLYTRYKATVYKQFNLKYPISIKAEDQKQQVPQIQKRQALLQEQRNASSYNLSTSNKQAKMQVENQVEDNTVFKKQEIDNNQKIKIVDQNNKNKVEVSLSGNHKTEYTEMEQYYPFLNCQYFRNMDFSFRP